MYNFATTVSFLSHFSHILKTMLTWPKYILKPNVHTRRCLVRKPPRGKTASLGQLVSKSSDIQLRRLITIVEVNPVILLLRIHSAKRRENACDQATIALYFYSDWLKMWRSIFEPIIKLEITTDTHSVLKFWCLSSGKKWEFIVWARVWGLQQHSSYRRAVREPTIWHGVQQVWSSHSQRQQSRMRRSQDWLLRSVSAFTSLTGKLSLNEKWRVIRMEAIGIGVTVRYRIPLNSYLNSIEHCLVRVLLLLCPGRQFMTCI